MAHGRLAYESHNCSTDPALVDITVRLDPAKWSTRKKNIITRCIKSGFVEAGFKTVALVCDIMEANGIAYKHRRQYSYYNRQESVVIEEVTVKPERLDELKAVVTAALKLKRATTDNQNTYGRSGGLMYEERMFLAAIDGEQTNQFWDDRKVIPVPKHIPLDEYLVEDKPSDIEAKEALCQMIWDNKYITAIYQPNA